MSRSDTIAVIGAGQLGSRYLQSMAGSLGPARIFVVDPSAASLERAATLVAAVPATHCTFEYLSSPAQVPSELDLAIVPSTATARLEILEALLARREVKKLLLEKVLFQSLPQLHRATKLLDKKRIPTWVNCARRLYDFYGAVAEYFGEERRLHWQLTGGEWGLACNAVHFLDAMAYLTGSPLQAVDFSGVDPELVPAKRPGFSEVYGALHGAYANGSTIQLISRRDSHASHLVVLSSETKSAILDEPSGRLLFRNSEGDWTQQVHRIPYLSEYMGPLVKDLLLTGDCQLPTYQESAALHQPFLEAFSQRVGLSVLPIT